ncbi:MAG: glycosyltransferase family 39 protein [Gemmatimonadetes bacterium]|nr:glycosyltransferase family 39 protein [Gemmatimonadota bacterium]
MSLQPRGTLHSRGTVAAELPGAGSPQGFRRFDELFPRAALVGLMLLSAALRVHQLGRESFWLDEAFSVLLARADGRWFFHALADREANMALYYGLLRLWTVAGEGEAWVRGLSVLASVLTVPAVYALGTRLFGRRAGLLAALLLTLNAFHVRYAQEARGYAALVLFATLASLLFARGLVPREGSRRVAIWMGWALVCALAAYSHFFGALVPAAHLASLAFHRGGRRSIPWRPLAAATVAVVLLVLPLGLFIVHRDVGQVSWIEPPSPVLLRTFFRRLAGGGGDSLLAAYVGLGLLALWPWGQPAAGAGAVLRDPQPNSAGSGWAGAFLLLWLLLPVTLVYLVSRVKPLFVDRYLSFCLPPFVLLAAAGLQRVAPRAIRAAMLLALVALAGRGLVWYYDGDDKEDWRGATAHILAEARRGDAVVFHAAYVARAYEYYRDRFEAGRKPPALVSPSLGYVHFVRTADPRELTPSLLRSLPKRYGRVWIVLSHEGFHDVQRAMTEAEIHGELVPAYPSVSEHAFKDIRVRLYSRAAEPRT